MIKYLKYLFVILIAVIGLESCDDPLTASGSTCRTYVSILITFPELDEKAEVVDENCCLRVCFHSHYLVGFDTPEK
ncbi:MAG: hypothetical protein K2M31_02075 [Muribaculaceae bacterium]|nr:hypothetical protein [Muribaculaceae bacterium]